MGQDKAGAISNDEIVALNAKLKAVAKVSSAARKKLAIRRVVRGGEALITKQPSAANRYKVLDILFRSQQVLLSLDNSTVNRKAFIATCTKLAAAPNKYAAIRLDADLLLTQAKSARLGANTEARSNALRPLVERYQDTVVEAKVIRVAMIMALEFGNTRLVNDLREVIAQRLPGNLDLINFQRKKLAGQVFGAPFVASFKRADGKTMRFPMDFLGTTTWVYFWSKEKDGLEDLKELAVEWKKAKVLHKAAGRFQIVSMNMDNLPDAGEKYLRDLGLDWQALSMPKGAADPIFQTYVKRDIPALMTVSPTGYVALYQSGGRSYRNFERRLQSMMARMWTDASYSSQLQAIFAAEFLVIDPQADFDPAAPPEYKAVNLGNAAKLPRTAASVPEDKLRAIQACFIKAPLRYRTPNDQVIANFKQADSLCRAAIAAHPKAPDLWIVRNRRITALMGLWRAGDKKAFASAVTEANAAMKSGYPTGTDVVARLCLAREAFRAANADPKVVINNFLKASGEQQTSAPVLAAASLLALDTADRKLHDQFRRSFLDKHASNPMMWTTTAYFLNRFHRYWMYHPPFTAGWTYGRRQGYFLGLGTHEEAKRTFKTEFKTLEGKTVKVPESSNGKWTVISFVPTVLDNGYLNRHVPFLTTRPLKDVNLINAVLDDNVDTARKLIEDLNEKNKTSKRKIPLDLSSTVLVPRGLQSPILRQLGILREETKPNILVMRPDGSIALALSGLTMSYQKGGYVIQKVIELQDEKNVDAALARGDLKEAKRLAFTLAPLPERPVVDPKKRNKKKPVKISNPHLRSRAKVYLAMGNFKAAAADIEKVYLAVNIKSGHISMRTKELEETEALKATILAALKKEESEK
jgi:hypothetical protein